MNEKKTLNKKLNKNRPLSGMNRPLSGKIESTKQTRVQSGNTNGLSVSKGDSKLCVIHNLLNSHISDS